MVLHIVHTRFLTPVYVGPCQPSNGTLTDLRLPSSSIQYCVAGVILCYSCRAIASQLPATPDSSDTLQRRMSHKINVHDAAQLPVLMFARGVTEALSGRWTRPLTGKRLSFSAAAAPMRMPVVRCVTDIRYAFATSL